MTDLEKETLLKTILERVEQVSQRRSIPAGHSQAIQESIKHLFTKKLG